MQSYRLHIVVAATRWITVGRLGRFRFPAGRYVYTGSARRHMDARIRRHLGRAKRLRWHIDYLLTAPGVRIVKVDRSRHPECRLNRLTPGSVPVPGFGASDCRAGCGSHLKYLDDPAADVPA